MKKKQLYRSILYRSGLYITSTCGKRERAERQSQSNGAEVVKPRKLLLICSFIQKSEIPDIVSTNTRAPAYEFGRGGGDKKIDERPFVIYRA